MSKSAMSKASGKPGAKSAKTGLARRIQALMADDLGGTIAFSALAYVKASLQGFAAERANFKAVKDAVDSGEMAVDLAMKSVENHPIESILAARGANAACASGCAFCCILTPDGNGAPITRHEAERMFDALVRLRELPDARTWHPHACAALDPDTRRCRVYEARPVLCRATASADAAVCEALSEGDTSKGTNARHAAAYMLHVAQELGRRSMGAQAPTYALARYAAAVVAGADLETALQAARHRPVETSEITRDAVAAFAHATRDA